MNYKYYDIKYSSQPFVLLLLFSFVLFVLIPVWIPGPVP